jgi:predicted GIY-YIG superfamily endonuclease
VDAYGRPSGRPRWLAGEYLALLERQGRGIGVIYLIHFDRPIGDLRNPRGFASHYTGWTLDLPSRLVLHSQGRGARLMQVVGEQGIGWQLARIWTGTRARERSLKQRGATRRCPVCQLAALGLQPPRPVDPLAVELGVRVAGSAAPVPPLEVPPAVAA